ncbi:MAG: autotransporter-associated beta strand repeat-containing protein [Verrucomicrobia bacterium]|nr:autotransporter-associated beta strand repeat-containing protein [Verrucomicrobiota bacterium]
MILNIRPSRLGALSLAILSLWGTGPATADPQEILVLGSSVAAGTGANPTSQAWAYRLDDLMENHAPIAPGSSVTWQVNNASVGGDTTSKVLARFQADVVTAHPGSDIVIIALSMANEGLVGASDPEAVFNGFKNGLTQIIGLCRTNGYYPVISLVYPNDNYSANEYAYVKRMNLLLNTWNIPSINFLGAIDDGYGHWAPGHVSDAYHPNASGHGELYYAVAPSMFDAITAGKTTSPNLQTTNGYLRLQRDEAESSPLRFTPGHPMHSFTLAFRVRSAETGTIAAVGAGTNRVTMEIRDTAFVYVGPSGAELSVPMDANDGRWHDVALSHRYATGQSLLFIDGVLKGTVSDQYIPDLFVIGGAAGAAGRALAPLQADFQDLCVYRAAWTQDEANAQSKGALQQASLEICAPLADTTLENRAQSMSAMSLHTANVSSETTATAPEGLNAPTVTPISVSLTWTAHGGDGFVIERRRTNVAESWATAGTSPAGTPSFTDTGLTPGTSYDYRVASQNGTLVSDYSNIITAITAQIVPQGGLIWDANTGTAGAQDGSGTWDATTTANWYDDSTNRTWGNTTNPANLAQFGAGGTSGTVTLSGTLNANGVYFSQSGYTLTGGTLNLTPSAGSPFVYTTSAGTSTINSTISSAGGTQIWKAGPGTLALGNGGGGSGTSPAFYTITGGAFNATSGVFDSILSLPAGNRLGVQASSPTTVLTLDAGTLQISTGTGNALALNRKVLVNAAGGAITDFGNNNFYEPAITNNAAAGSSLYLSNISGITQFRGVISGPGGVTWYGAGTASMQAANTYTGGTTLRAGTLSVNQTNGIGSGDLTFAGNATLQAGAAGVTLPNAINLGTNSGIFDTNGNVLTLTGAISNPTTTNNAVKAAGSGTLVLAGPLNLTGHATDTNNPALMMGSRNGATFSRGTVTITGTGSISRISTGWDNTANVLNFASTGTVTMATDLVSGQSANGQGVINFTTGTLILQNFNIANWDGAYGGFTMSGGTMNTINFRNGGTGNGNGNSYSLMTGGTINVAEVTTLSRQGTGTNVLYLNGASAQFNEGNNRFNLGFSTGSTGIVTVASGLLTVGSNLSLAEGGAGTTGIVNLNGGIIRPNVIVAPNAAGNSIVNFNGGTLQANIDHTNFMNGLTSSNIFAGGATIDTNGKNVTIGQALLSAAGSGVSNIQVATGGAGYLGTPVVKITGGGGTGATAVAVMSGGVITGIQITSPGTGYTSAPTVTLTGGGSTTAATVGTVSTAANAADGGLTKSGAGTLTLTGSSTYAGATTVTSGVLATNNLRANGTASGIGLGSSLNLNGGTLRYTGGSNNNGFNRTITAGAGGGTLDNAGGTFVFYSGSFAGSGSLAFVDSSSSGHEWLITGSSSGFSGNVQVGNGSARSGTLQYRSDNANPFGTGTIQINGGGVVTADFGSTNPSTLANNVILNGGTLGTQQSNITYTGAVSLLADSILGHAYNGTVGNVTINGVISGASAIGISTAASVTLAAANTYTGPTRVDSGTLVLTGSLPPESAVTVSAGATLTGNGTANGPVTTVGATSVIAPGTAGIGTLALGNTVLTGILATELDATACDQLSVTGNLDVTGATVAFTRLAPAAAPIYVIAKYTGTLTGTLATTTLPAGYQLVHDLAAKEIRITKANFTGFMDAYPGLNAADKLPDADPDGDGVCNLIEYALAGFDPTLADSATPGSLADGVLTFLKRAAAVANGDLTYMIEQSPTLGTAPTPWTEVMPTANDDTAISYALPIGQPAQFARLKVTSH